MPDDGSSMIGCDICDDWYHWLVKTDWLKNLCTQLKKTVEFHGRREMTLCLCNLCFRVCVNITAEPTDEQWYCPRCMLKNQGGEEKKKRGRKPKAGRGRGKKKMSF